MTKTKWLKKIAGQHAKLGNKLLSTAKRIKAEGYHREERQGTETNKKLIGTTIHSYIMLAAEQAKKHSLTEEQEKQVKSNWQKRGGKNKKWMIKTQKAARTTSTSTTFGKLHKNSRRC